MQTIDQKEQENRQAIEKANSYRQMFEQWAWKDFEQTLKELRQAALERTIWTTTMEDVQLQRGYVKCIDEIMGSLSFVTEVR